MTCDLCPAELPPDTPMQVDASGRPVLLACSRCNDEIVRERSRRLGLTAADDLLDRFAAHLALVIKPPFCTFVNSPSDGYRMPNERRRT